MKTRYLTLGSLLGLAGGTVLGLFAHLRPAPFLQAAARHLGLFGELWTNLLSLIVTPMIVVSIFLAVLSFTRTRAAGRIGALALLVHAGILVVTSALTVSISLWIVPKIPVALPAPGSGAGTTVESVTSSPALEALKGIVSMKTVVGPVRDAVIPIVMATFLLALASSCLAESRRKALFDLFRRASVRLISLLHGFLLLIPAAVFTLSFAQAAETGLSIAGVVVSFIVLVSALLILATLGLYPLAALSGRVPLRTYAAALWPSQAVAAGTRSSLASLPTLLEGAAELGLPAPIAGFVLPVSVAAFKLTRAISSPLKLVFLAHVYGLDLAPATVIGFALTALLISFTTPGVPSAGSRATLPLYLAAGIPLEGVILLNSVDAVPDIFKTILHVSESMAVTVIVSRKGGGLS